VIYIHILYVWASVHPIQAMAQLMAGLLFLQTMLDNWHVKLGWKWAGRLSLFLASMPLSGSMTGMASAFKSSTPLPPVAPPAPKE
jgi:hypothetical protein